MADEEQLSILKQGVEVWNEWRNSHSYAAIDLAGADLSGANLREAFLSSADLKRAFLVRSYLMDTDLKDADISDAVLIEAALNGADLKRADLTRTNLSGADLRRTNLTRTNLSEANLSEANLREARFNGAKFRHATLENAILGGTFLCDIDLRNTKDLDTVQHEGPSFVSTSTLQKSQGNIPDIFLKGCGLSNWEIEMAKLYNPELSNGERNQILYKIYDLQASQAIQISPLFISYSHADKEFVDKLDKCLNEKGVRFWRDIHDLRAGKIEKQLDQAISQDRTVLLVLSEHSLKSDWVEHEVRKAREIAKNAGRDTLCPVALDDSWKSSPWPKRVMEQIKEYNILDFSAWEDDVQFEGMFRKLIDGLELFYKG